MAPGSERSLRDPSKTTTMSRREPALLDMRSRSAFCRAVMMACSSAIRAATVSASLPISATQFCPSAGRQCGSHRAHSHAGLPAGVGEHAELDVLRAVQGGDLGDQPAAGGPGHVAGSGDARRPPVRPAAIVTGASGISQNSRRRCSSWAGSVSSTADGRSAVPTRSSR